MKPIIQYLFFLPLIFISITARGQQITGIIFLPDSPNTNDYFSVELSTLHTSSDCFIVDSTSSVTIKNDTISIKATYEYGILPTLCTRIDTFQVGLLNAGSYIIYIELYQNGSPPLFSDTKDTILTVIPSTGIKKNDEYSSYPPSIKLFPNPFYSSLNLQFETSATASAQFILYDFTGKEIISIKKKQLSMGTHHEQINTAQFTPGIYLIKANICTDAMPCVSQTIKIIKL